MAGRARTLRRLAFVGFFVATAIAQATAPAAPESELTELRARIEKLQRDLAAAEGSRGEAAGELRANARALSEAHRALFDLATRRRDLEASLEGIARQQRERRARIASEEDAAAKLLRLQYEQGAPDRLRLALEGRDAATVARHIAYYGYIQKARAELVASLRARGAELSALESDARARRDELAANERSQAEETRRLEKERAARAALVTRLAGEIERGRREIGRLKRDEARLSRLVEEIARALAAPGARPPAAQALADRASRNERRRGCGTRCRGAGWPASAVIPARGNAAAAPRH